MNKKGAVKKIMNKTEDAFVSTIKYPFVFHNRTFGQKSSDFIAKWAGSWIFIILFFVFLGLWITTNIYAWTQQWDPYPFILLNLALSCLAAIQAPIILMSQNRAAQRDRLKSEIDYRINKKAEKEIQEIQTQLNRIERKIKNIKHQKVD